MIQEKILVVEDDIPYNSSKNLGRWIWLGYTGVAFCHGINQKND